MTFYWDRCDVCGRRRPSRTCWLYPERGVCPYCCVACPDRGQCPRPIWFPELVVKEERVARRVRRREAVSALEELLKRLEGGE